MKQMISNKIKRHLFLKFGLPAICYFLIAFLIINIPLFIVYEIKEMFNSWFSGKSGQYSNVNEAVLDWLDTIEDDVLIDDMYITKKDIKKYIKAENDTFMGDVPLTVKENITVRVHDSKNNSRTENTYQLDQSYMLNLGNATAKYRLPWQTMIIMNSMHNTAANTVEDNESTILNLFGTKYFGMFEGEESSPVSRGQIKSGANFKYKSTVKKTTKEVTEYYVTTKKIVEDPKTRKKTVKLIEEGPYYKTTYTVREVSYPLPYFTSISTMTTNYEFSYDYKTTKQVEEYKDGSNSVTITTDTTTPYMTVNDELDIDRYAANISAFDISPSDIEYMAEQIRALPGGETAVAAIDSITGQMYNFQNFDFYYGAENGNGKFKLSGEGLYAWPVRYGINITSGFGYRIHPTLKELKFHSGIDIGVPNGTQVLASADGKVIYAGSAGTYGVLVKIEHEGNMETRYAHLTVPTVKVGDIVTKGTVIAYSGNTGRSTGPHLHFETLKNGNPVDPANYLGLVPDMPTILPEDLRYRTVDAVKLKSYLSGRNSILAVEPYTNSLIKAAHEFDINPLLLYAITGQEMSYVKNNTDFWINVYGRPGLESKIRKVLVLQKDTRTADEIINNNLVPRFIANNAFNVFHSWWEYNTNPYDTAKVACRTIKTLSKDCPAGYNVLLWINTRGGRGGYAEDKNWWIGVSKNLEALEKSQL